MSLLCKSFGKKCILFFFFPKSVPKVLTWTSLPWFGPNFMDARLPWPRAHSALMRWYKITCPLLELESPTEGRGLWWKDVALRGKQMFGLRISGGWGERKTNLWHATWLHKTNDDFESTDRLLDLGKHVRHSHYQISSGPWNMAKRRGAKSKPCQETTYLSCQRGHCRRPRLQESLVHF